MEHLSVVIPALDAAAGLPSVLRSLQGAAAAGTEIIVVDGGSADGTGDIARGHGAAVIEAPRGRGIQMAAGASAARGSWLLFLHADTVPGEGWEQVVRAFMADPANRECAAVFRLRFDDPSFAARCVERLAAWRSRWLGLPYGDQGLLISRAFHDELGGFRPIPIMEDVDMVRRIGRRRLATLACPAHTSAVRYRRAGFVPRMLRNLLCLASYYLGMPPAWLVRLYG